MHFHSEVVRMTDHLPECNVQKKTITQHRSALNTASMINVWHSKNQRIATGTHPELDECVLSSRPDTPAVSRHEKLKAKQTLAVYAERSLARRLQRAQSTRHMSQPVAIDAFP
jgi:hypothetical protein